MVDMHGGLGHRFLAFSHLIIIASVLRLTLRLRFGSAGHYQQKTSRLSMAQNLLVSRSYFFGDVLFAPLPDGPVRYISVDSPKALAAAVAVARREHCPSSNARQDIRDTQNMASAPKAVVFNLSVCSIPFGSSSHHLDVPNFRKAFQENAAQRTRTAQQHLGVQISARGLTNTSRCAALSSGTERPRIAVHIRRGDVLDCNGGNFSRVPNRGLANAAYVDLLQQLTGRLQHSAIFSRTITPLTYNRDVLHANQAPLPVIWRHSRSSAFPRALDAVTECSQSTHPTHRWVRKPGSPFEEHFGQQAPSYYRAKVIMSKSPCSLP